MIGGRNRFLSIGIFLALLYIAVEGVGGTVTPLNLVSVVFNLFIYVVLFNVGLLASNYIQVKLNK